MSKQCCGNIIIFQAFEFHCFLNVFPSLTNVGAVCSLPHPQSLAYYNGGKFFQTAFSSGGAGKMGRTENPSLFSFPSALALSHHSRSMLHCQDPLSTSIQRRLETSQVCSQMGNRFGLTIFLQLCYLIGVDAPLLLPSSIVTHGTA